MVLTAEHRRQAAFSEYHDATKNATKGFWDHADFECFDNKQGFSSWGARNC